MLAKYKRLPPGVRLAHAQTLRGSFLMLKIQKTHAETFRFGTVISKKIDKRSAQRNRTRRILVNQVEVMDPGALVGYDILCIVTKPVSQPDEEKARRELTHLLNQKI